jgi:hypothetical protein
MRICYYIGSDATYDDAVLDGTRYTSAYEDCTEKLADCSGEASLPQCERTRGDRSGKGLREGVIRLAWPSDRLESVPTFATSFAPMLKASKAIIVIYEE